MESYLSLPYQPLTVVLIMLIITLPSQLRLTLWMGLSENSVIQIRIPLYLLINISLGLRHQKTYLSEAVRVLQQDVMENPITTEVLDTEKHEAQVHYTETPARGTEDQVVQLSLAAETVKLKLWTPACYVSTVCCLSGTFVSSRKVLMEPYGSDQCDASVSIVFRNVS